MAEIILQNFGKSKKNVRKIFFNKRGTYFLLLLCIQILFKLFICIYTDIFNISIYF